MKMARVIRLVSICNSRIMWFVFLGIRLATLYVYDMPWRRIYSDFRCSPDTSTFCRKACFKVYLDIDTAWTFTYILFIICILLLELVSSHLDYNLTKVKMKEGELVENIAPAAPSVVQMQFQAQKGFMKDTYQRKLMLVLYLAYILLRMHIEIAFLYILVMWHLPNLIDRYIECSTWLCPVPYTCVLLASADKRFLVYMLYYFSVIIIGFCIVFTSYKIYCYRVMGCSHLVNSKLPWFMPWLEHLKKCYLQIIRDFKCGC